MNKLGTATAHTAGDWEVMGHDSLGHDAEHRMPMLKIGTRNSDNSTNVFAWAWSDGSSQYLANTRLIAAAPELLHGLKMAVAWLENQGYREDRMPRGIDSIDQLRETIAKASSL